MEYHLIARPERAQSKLSAGKKARETIPQTRCLKYLFANCLAAKIGFAKRGKLIFCNQPD
jgi:hypothetical protein